MIAWVTLTRVAHKNIRDLVRTTTLDFAEGNVEVRTTEVRNIEVLLPIEDEEEEAADGEQEDDESGEAEENDESEE